MTDLADVWSYDGQTVPGVHHCHDEGRGLLLLLLSVVWGLCCMLCSIDTSIYINCIVCLFVCLFVACNYRGLNSYNHEIWYVGLLSDRKHFAWLEFWFLAFGPFFGRGPRFSDFLVCSKPKNRIIFTFEI